MNKHYYVIQRVRLYGRSYEVGEVIEADDADVADLVGSALKEADRGETLLGNQDGKQFLRALVRAEFERRKHLPLAEALAQTYEAVAAQQQVNDTGPAPTDAAPAVDVVQAVDGTQSGQMDSPSSDTGQGGDVTQETDDTQAGQPDGQPGDDAPPTGDTQTDQPAGQTDAGSDSQPPQEPAVKKAPVVKKAGTTKASSTKSSKK